MKKRILSLLLAGTMTCTPALAAGSQRTEGNWYDEAMAVWVERGVFQGDQNGNLRPTAPITRAELATVLDRIMDYQLTMENPFPDVAEDAWYAEAVLKACAAGVLQGDGVGARPGSPITRQEAMVMLSRVLNLTGAPQGVDAFQDGSQVAPWARDAVGAMAQAGYVQGFAGSIRPTHSITRAEVAVMLDNVFAATFDQAGTYSQEVDGSAVIKAGDVTLQNMTIGGDLIVAEGVADGHVVLDGVTVTGQIIVRGGGENSVVLKGQSQADRITVARQGGGVRVSVEEEAQVKDVVVSGAGQKLTLQGTVEQLTVTGANASVSTDGRISLVSVEESAHSAAIEAQAGAEIGSVVTAGAATAVTGAGTVSKVEAAQGATGTTVSTAGTQVENNSGEAVTIPGGTVEPGQSGVTSGEDSSDSSKEQAEAALKELVRQARDYNGYEDQPDGVWPYQSDFALAETQEGLALTVAYSMEQMEDGTVVKDLARFLGALYRQDEGQTCLNIVYQGETFTWDADRGLLGSNWVKDPEQPENSGNTLVSVLGQQFTSQGRVDELTLQGPHEAALRLTLDVGVAVHTGEELTAALASPAARIELGGSFAVDRQIGITRPVELDGKGFTLTASEAWSDAGKQLLNIKGTDGVVFRNLTLNSAGQAYGVQVYQAPGAAFHQVTLQNSVGSGLTVNASTLTAEGLQVKGSAWQGINLSGSAGSAPVLTLTDARLEDTLSIVEDISGADSAPLAQVTLDGEQLEGSLYRQNCRYKQVFLLNAPLAQMVLSAEEYTYADGYAYTGAFDPVLTGALADGLAVEVSAAYEDAQSLANGDAVKDLARFLGALYWQDNGQTVASLTWKEQVYTWANGDHAANIGSNWVKDPEQPASSGNTLVSDVVAAYEESPQETFPLVFTLTDGQGNTLNLTLTITAEEG